MKQRKPHLGIGAHIVTGFVIVLMLMASLTATGLQYVANANHRLKQIVENNNVKTTLATEMQTALRERALSMYVLVILTDPFDKDDEYQRFNAYGSRYTVARQHLERLPLTENERQILATIRELTRAGQPEVQDAVEMAISHDTSTLFETIRQNILQNAMPRQRQISEQVNLLIRVQEDQTSAAVQNAEASYIQARDLMLLLGVATLVVGMGIAAYVSRRVSRQAEQLATQALYDPLTHLPNRDLLHDRLAQEIAYSTRANTGFAVVLMDLDRFKEVNDTLGHEAGDELLCEVGRRLKQAARMEDTVARLGGDEYVIILHEVGKEAVPTVAKKLLSALNAPFRLSGQSVDISGSLGISFFPEHAEDASTLIRKADIAMYVAKRAGKGYAIYSPDQENVSSRSRLSLKSELREAIQTGQLCLHYQPKINHQLKQVIGVEALVRWNHPQRGFLPPDQFIPLAEESGLIGPLDQWVLKTAIHQTAALHEAGYPLTVAVNLSARSLHDTELPAIIMDLLRHSGGDAGMLTLEITESAVMSNPSDSLGILQELDRMGIAIAIDDFGTGYSSLAYLRQLPVDELKIDKSFVMSMEKNENDAVIVRSTIDLAHNLGLDVTAEGVENRDTWDTLTILGCDVSQGYFMSKPLPTDKLMLWLNDSPWSAPQASRVSSTP
jgi:diguanylate cyclase (GGDEF)-like protein